MNDELLDYKLRCEKLQAIVLAKDKDIKELEAKTFFLETRASAFEDENKSLKLAMKIVMQENETEFSTTGGKDDCRDNFCQVRAKNHKNQPYRKARLNTNEPKGSTMLTQNRFQSLENTRETEIQRGKNANKFTAHNHYYRGFQIEKSKRSQNVQGQPSRPIYLFWFHYKRNV